jgi:hypothetical protein
MRIELHEHEHELVEHHPELERLEHPGRREHGDAQGR